MSERFYSTETHELTRSPAKRHRNLRLATLAFILAVASATAAVFELVSEDRDGVIALLQILTALAMAAIAGRELVRARTAVDDPEVALGPVVALDDVGVHYRDLGMGAWRTLRWEEMEAVAWAGDNIGVRRRDGEVEMVDVGTLSDADRHAVERQIRDRLAG